MKKKKFILGVSILLFIIVLIVGYFLLRKDNTTYQGEKFSLDSEYYHAGEFVDVTPQEVETALKEKKSFLLFTYNNFCNFDTPADQIFQEIMDRYQIDVLKIPFEEFKETSLYQTIKLGPSLVIIKEGKLVSYLKADEDADIDKYQKPKTFESWLDQYIYLEKK